MNMENKPSANHAITPTKDSGRKQASKSIRTILVELIRLMCEWHTELAGESLEMRRDAHIIKYHIVLYTRKMRVEKAKNINTQ